MTVINEINVPAARGATLDDAHVGDIRGALGTIRQGDHGPHATPAGSGHSMDEGPSCPVAHRSGAAAGIPSGNSITFPMAVTRSGRGGVGT